MPKSIIILSKKETKQSKKLIPKKTKYKSNTLTLKQIPTKNRVNVIDNFSQYNDFIIEGDKLYKSDKGKSRWEEIKDEKLLYQLLKFLKDNYDFRGYLDNEQDVYRSLNNKYNPTPYSTERYAKSLLSKLTKPLIIELKPKIVLKKKYINSKSIKPQVKPVTNPFIFSINPLQLKVSKPGDVGAVWNTLMEGKFKDAWKLINNGLSNRINDKYGNPNPLSEFKNDSIKNDQKIIKNILKPTSYTGDTIKNFRKPINSRLYILPESLYTEDYTFNVRNRNDNTPLNTEGAVITSLYPFVKFGLQRSSENYIGIDSNGKLKVGPITEFSDDNMLAPIIANDVVSFIKDSEGNYNIYPVPNSEYGNPSFVLWNNGNPIKKRHSRAVNFRINKKDPKGLSYDGRVLIKTGNEIRLISGSLSNIDNEFEKMKKRNNVSYGTFYTLDNGSFYKGFRTTDKKLTSSDLHNYDMQNWGGGHFMYITNKNEYSN